MKKLNKFFITALVAGLVAFSAVLVVPTQLAQALVKTNQIEDNAITSPKIKDGEVKTPDLATAAVTKEKLNPSAVKLIVTVALKDFSVPAHSSASGFAECNSGEIVTGGGFFLFDDTLIVTQNTPSGVGSWGVTAVNNGDNTELAKALAQCAHLELGP
jgi:hypothetical protein